MIFDLVVILLNDYLWDTFGMWVVAQLSGTDRWVSCTATINLAYRLSREEWKEGRTLWASPPSKSSYFMESMHQWCPWISQSPLNWQQRDTNVRFWRKNQCQSIESMSLKPRQLNASYGLEGPQQDWALSSMPQGHRPHSKHPHLWSCFWSQNYKYTQKEPWETDQVRRIQCKPPWSQGLKSNKGGWHSSFCAPNVVALGWNITLHDGRLLFVPTKHNRSTSSYG